MTTELQLTESLAPAGTKTVGKRWRARIIEADRWGSSAYYPGEVLERDGARVFTKGLAMYADHPTESDAYERPERSIKDMVGKLISEAVYGDEGEGPGLYADVEFYDSFLSEINEKHQDVGLSVRATGLTEWAEMDGREGPVLVGLLAADSVDVVTRAGAGGKLTSILESDRETAGRPITRKEAQSVTDVTKEDFDLFKTELVEAIAGIPAAIAESLKPAIVEPVEKTAEELAAEAAALENDKVEPVEIDHAAIVEALAANNLPAVTSKKIVESIKAGATLEDAVKEQTELREAFLATGTESGTIVITESGKPATGLARAVSVLS